MEETGRKCERPTQQGVLTVLDTWSNGLMGMLSTSVTGNLSDWTMVIEWNKPVSTNNYYSDVGGRDFNGFLGLIVVGDECWRRFMLMTSFRW